MTNFPCLIPVFPLAAFAINIFFGKRLGRNAAWVSILASLVSCAIALPIIADVALGGHTLLKEATWLTLGTYELKFGYYINAPAASLLFVVTIIGTLIQIYSVGYMHDDARFSRFFAYLSLFMFAMLTLVIANNYILFFMAWEIMGLCSYLLIGFWFEKNSAANAAKKAFMTTRVGDVGFFLGMMTLFVTIGTLSFPELEHASKAAHGSAFLPLAAFLIFCGTIGKSAQFPLHVWLPDAMEGPTPVSALIHAATMVAAGVYLVARSFPLFEEVPQILSIVTTIGAITAFMAAFIALTATDIKKVLAYSTISQLGFMVTALGLGGFAAGNFHLMTHAFFKALLFLGAGSVIHGTHTQDIREMGGLFGKMKSTAFTFLIGTLAIAGIPPLAGFWSKDEILVAAYKPETMAIFWILVVTAFMTSFYMFRLTFLTFFGKLRNHKIHAHESPAVMTLPLWVLAIGSIVVGLPGSPWAHHWFQSFIVGGHHSGGEPTSGNFVIITSLAVGFGGLFFAALFYLTNLGLPEKVAGLFKPLYVASQNKFWFDEIYNAIIVRPFLALSRALFGFDQKVIDGAVNGVGFLTLWKSNIHYWIDKHIVDGLVNLVGHITQIFSAILRRIQTGLVQNYLLIVFLSVLLILFFEFKT
ncbi:MAG: NADH-quinone oxidoreductase subunit L [Candidatus Omnitrophica bacterium]|nr:NADH-quinone oxidoreductase subunit L [Candidatus Omnitrophota bacterium]